MSKESSLKITLERWYNSSPRYLLDFRSLHDHNTRRIIPSTCIPHDELKRRQYELPHKSLPFSVLEPEGFEGIAKKLLVDQGWNVQLILTESEKLWEAGRELAIVEELDEGSKLCETKRRWILFQPCPFLVNAINSIEESLGNSNQENTTFKCIDIACGSGRDVSWLCLRQSVEWRVTAIDAMAGAISRTRQLAEGLDVLHKIRTIHAKILSDGTLKLSPTRIGDTDSKLLTLTSDTGFLSEGYDLILCIRFLCRGFFCNMDKLVKPGGFLLISTFVDDGLHIYEKPKGESHRLKLGELEKTFQGKFEILQDKIELLEDGRPVNSFLARKKL